MSPCTLAPLPADALDELAAQPGPLPWYCSGLPTSAAGLFFLLNALERIGISQALAGSLAWSAPNFAARVLRHLAAQVEIPEHDPIVQWLDSLLLPDTKSQEPLRCDPSWWPSNLRLSRDTAALDDLVRAWSVAARRWCWRMGKINVREIVSRAGIFSVDRTDLDVSMPLDRADVRVRRIGLDLDPGWLPWFGRVVRFHYPHRGDFHG